ncbi:MAG: hypothetical protein NTZ20_04670 [Candidatus Levybacteria bacterium]|nr:hypothetical protein [Candidatus Levybacteria bacterium]
MLAGAGVVGVVAGAGSGLAGAGAGLAGAGVVGVVAGAGVVGVVAGAGSGAGAGLAGARVVGVVGGLGAGAGARVNTFPIPAATPTPLNPAPTGPGTLPPTDAITLNTSKATGRYLDNRLGDPAASLFSIEDVFCESGEFADEARNCLSCILGGRYLRASSSVYGRIIP